MYRFPVVCLLSATFTLTGCVTTAPTSTGPSTAPSSTRPTSVSEATEAGLRARVGQTLWLNPADPPTFYTAQGQAVKPWRDDFLIADFLWKEGRGLYQVKCGCIPEILYIYAGRFQESQYFTETQVELATAKKRAEEASKAEEIAAKEAADQKEKDTAKVQVDSALAKDKLTPGTVLWTKIWTRQFPGLTKVTVVGIRFNQNFNTASKSPEKVDDVLVYVVVVSDAGKKDEFLVGTVGEVKKNGIGLKADSYYRKKPAWGAARIKAIQEGTVILGMTDDQLVAARGYPRKINESTGPWGTHEQWIYGDSGPYFYVENGRVTSWQR